jgi:6-phosphogluconolactonase
MALDLEVLPDPQAAAERGAEVVAAAAANALAERGRFTLALSGGSTPGAMFAALYGRLPWESVTIFQVDERIAPDEDPDRNLTLLRRSLPPGGAADVRPIPVAARALADDAARSTSSTWASARTATRRRSSPETPFSRCGTATSPSPGSTRAGGG